MTINAPAIFLNTTGCAVAPAIFPVPPGGFALGGSVRFIGDCDECHLPLISVGAAGTIVTGFDDFHNRRTWHPHCAPERLR